jgi:hypothetical protein
VKNSKLYQAYLAEKKAMENQNKQPFEKKENTTNSTEKLSNETKNNVIFQTNINVNNAR